MKDYRKNIDRLLGDIHDEKRLEKIYWFIVRLLAITMAGDPK